MASSTARGLTTTYEYDAQGRLRRWVDGVGRGSTLTRDLFGNVASTDDGQARQTFTYDVGNRLLTARDAAGNETLLEYTHAGCGCTERDLVSTLHTPDMAPGEAFRFDYGPEGRLAKVTDPHGFAEGYSYEPTGELAGVTDRLLRATSMTHDQLGRLSGVVDALGRRRATAHSVPTPDPLAADKGTWVGPTLPAGSGDATPASTSLTAPLRSGDYQIGADNLATQGYPAGRTLYRDATLTLAFDHTFDLNGRLTTRKDSRHTNASRHRFEFYQHDPRTTGSAPTLSDSSSPDFYIAGSDTVSTTLDDDLVPTGALGPQRNYIHTSVTYTRDVIDRRSPDDSIRGPCLADAEGGVVVLAIRRGRQPGGADVVDRSHGSARGEWNACSMHAPTGEGPGRGSGAPRQGGEVSRGGRQPRAALKAAGVMSWRSRPKTSR